VGSRRPLLTTVGQGPMACITRTVELAICLEFASPGSLAESVELNAHDGLCSRAGRADVAAHEVAVVVRAVVDPAGPSALALATSAGWPHPREAIGDQRSDARGHLSQLMFC
jgi:hypothetical protein